ncbi:MAG TPA: hypothetical protein VMD49_05745 [Steroidobacteraceae bacterium]|nr:hypothetical protein [Steroidobacteraceae bacterium]
MRSTWATLMIVVGLAAAAAPAAAQIAQADVTGGRIAGTVADGGASEGRTEA